MNRDQIAEAATDAAALVALGALAGSVHTNPHPDGRAFVILPAAEGGMKVDYLERPEYPARRKGTVQVSDTESFIEAVNRYASRQNTVLYASLHPAAFVAVLNDTLSGKCNASEIDASIDERIAALREEDRCPCGAIWTRVMFAYDGPHCARDDGARFLRARPTDGSNEKEKS